MLHGKVRMKESFCAAPTALSWFVQLTQGFRAWAKLFRSSGAASPVPIYIRVIRRHISVSRMSWFPDLTLRSVACPERP